jgi:3-hydroxymyristoyl/3-hydroxydecanoyl-(acyl carrier protein) dehydratase
VRIAPDEVTLDLSIAADHPAYRGHFPTMPILAGVIQLDWVLQLAAIHLGIHHPAATDFQVKYRLPIEPGQPLSLWLWRDAAHDRLTFEYRIAGEVASVGKIALVPR